MSLNGQRSRSISTSITTSRSSARLRQIFPKYFSPAQAKAYAGKPKAILSRAYANRLGNGPERFGVVGAIRLGHTLPLRV